MIKEENGENIKSISTIQTSFIEENEAELIKKEKELTKTLNDLREKHKNITLAYENVCDNIKALCEYHKENCGEIQEYKEEETAEKNEEGEEMKEEEKKEEVKEGEETKEEETKQNDVKQEEPKKEEVKPEEEKQVEQTIQAGEAVVEKKEGEGDNQQSLPNNLNTNAETEAQPIVVQETPEQMELINNYSNFLQQALKTFDILFLCHSKHEFLNLMREKGIEMQQQQANQGIRLNKKKRTTRRKITSSSRIAKTEGNIVNQGNEEEDNDEKYNPDKDILLRFVKEMKKSREEFVSAEKEKPKYVIKKPANN